MANPLFLTAFIESFAKLQKDIKSKLNAMEPCLFPKLSVVVFLMQKYVQKLKSNTNS